MEGMSLVEKVRSLVGDGDDSTYRYECENCGNGFESAAPNPNDVACPLCESGRVHSAL